MKKITKMDKQAADLLSSEALVILEAMAEKYDLLVQVAGGGRFDPRSGTFQVKFEFGVKTESGIPTNFERSAKWYGLKPSDYGRIFNYKGEDYIIEGINSRARKYTILCSKKSTGERFSFPDKDVVRLLGVTNLREATGSVLG